MLDDLLENKIIELLTPKRPEEAGRTTNDAIIVSLAIFSRSTLR